MEQLNVFREEAPRYGAPQLIAPRLGQGTFRVAVLEAYSRACCVTGEHSLPALEASHIRPYALAGRETCSERGQEFAVTGEQVVYNGLVHEQIQRDAALARRIVPVPIVRNIFIPDVSTRNDYQVGMRFHCVTRAQAVAAP